MSTPRWARALLRWLAPPDGVDDVLGDLEEAHRSRLARGGRPLAYLRTSLDALEMAWVLLRGRVRRRPILSWLDFKLGLRMLRKHPGLTLVGGLGMAAGIALAAGAFNVFYLWMSPHIPLDEGDRLVGVWNRDTRDNTVDRHALHDYVEWKDALTTIRDFGAYSTFRRNLIPPHGPPLPVTGAEMTASGFRTARVPPLMGRPLLPADERAGAPPVMVLSYPVWKERFGADPAVVGTTARLDTTTYTVVGVMPEGYAFPAFHKVWTPLRVDSLDADPAEGPSIAVFGHLAPDVSREEAQVELTALGRRIALADPGSHEYLQPRVVSFPALEGQDLREGGDAWQVFLTEIFLVLVLVVVGANVAILVYARTAMRQGEITVRTALGASRRRIVGQLFAEALVLASVAAVVGLVIAQIALNYMWVAIRRIEGTNAAFWQRNLHLAPGTLAFTAVLVVMSALIVGVLPGLKATSRHVQRRLSQLQGGTRMRLGGTWTVLIVAQIAVAVALLPAAIQKCVASIDFVDVDAGFPAEEYLTAGVEGPDALDRSLDTFERALEAQPGIVGVTWADHLPGAASGETIEVEDMPLPSDSAQGIPTRGVTVAPNYLEVFPIALRAGRTFTRADGDSTSTAVVVNESFVRDVLRGGSPLGRRIRDVTKDPAAESSPWREIVGVVADFPPKAWNNRGSRARIYHPAAPGHIRYANLFVHVRGVAPTSLMTRVREIGGTIDPTLELRRFLPLNERWAQSEVVVFRILILGLVLLTLSAILLSAAGIYALLSFTVTRRRREIGIRTALGANRGRILAGIFTRALWQLAAGGVVGVGGALLLDQVMSGQLLEGQGGTFLPLTVILMVAVGVAATVEPARRGLAVEPTEALRSE